jgi:hypothetical protein
MRGVVQCMFDRTFLFLVSCIIQNLSTFIRMGSMYERGVVLVMLELAI